MNMLKIISTSSCSFLLKYLFIEEFNKFNNSSTTKIAFIDAKKTKHTTRFSLIPFTSLIFFKDFYESLHLSRTFAFFYALIVEFGIKLSLL